MGINLSWGPALFILSLLTLPTLGLGHDANPDVEITAVCETSTISSEKIVEVVRNFDPIVISSHGPSSALVEGNGYSLLIALQQMGDMPDGGTQYRLVLSRVYITSQFNYHTPAASKVAVKALIRSLTKRQGLNSQTLDFTVSHDGSVVNARFWDPATYAISNLVPSTMALVAKKRTGVFSHMTYRDQCNLSLKTGH